LACPPKRSPVMMLDWKLGKGVFHGQEIVFSGADHQDDLVITTLLLVFRKPPRRALTKY
jgi:hypothetical protein